MRKYIIAGVLFVLASVSIWLGAAAPQWIQYSERVVGENSPFYDDVVNRPMKQIWANFTSQHTIDGGHKSFIFPTPIPTVAFPTPLPTATPKPDATPQPTCTPGPDFPTPLPTATPIPASIADQFFGVEHESNGQHHLFIPGRENTDFTINPSIYKNTRIFILSEGVDVTLPGVTTAPQGYYITIVGDGLSCIFAPGAQDLIMIPGVVGSNEICVPTGDTFSLGLVAEVQSDINGDWLVWYAVYNAGAFFIP